MTDKPEAPRWEWRTFAPSLPDIEARLGPEADVPAEESHEVYLLRGRTDIGLKIRGGALELKTLARIDERGLQLWRPSGRLELPAAAEAVATLLVPLGLVPPSGEMSGEDVIAWARAGDALRVAAVEKARRTFEHEGCRAELTDVTVGGRRLRTFCIESADRERLEAALDGLGLTGCENVSVPEALRRELGLAGGGDSDGTQDGQRRKNVEIERKFLVDTAQWKPVTEGIAFRQGYLSQAKERVVRVRVAGDEAFITIKGETAQGARAEYEYEIPRDDAEAMLAGLCERPLIDKTRHRQAFGGKVWEIDVFHGENDGLVVAEIELASASEAFERPPWAVRDVTRLPRYFNNNLIRRPFAAWTEAERAGADAAEGDSGNG